MIKRLLFVLTLLVCIPNNFAQQPDKPSTSEIFESVQKLNFLGSVLYVAAHPDDENTRLISYMSNHVKARTAYLSLTRGDGGQNLIGPELRELLGVIRTQELLGARSIDGGEQLFTRANDFGYSKHPDETLAIWDKDEVLSDVVLAIRKFQPDIIINRFDHRRAGRTHGHHTSSALLSMEAFDLVNDPNAYTHQLSMVSTWQPKRLFFNTGWWFYGSRENFEKADKSNMNTLDVGVYYPLKGMSNNEVASLASSQHLCQGFGRPTTRGSQTEYIEFLKGDPISKDQDVFAGIDTSWNRVEGGKAIGDILQKVEDNFNFIDPSVHIPELVKAYALLQEIKNEHWKSVKSKELLAIIEACAGLYLEASANTPTTAVNNDIEINLEVLNRSNTSIDLNSYQITDQNSVSREITSLKPNIKENIKETINVSDKLKGTSPYWLDTVGSLGMYRVEDSNLIGYPETPRALKVDFNLTIAGQPITITKDVVYRYSKPDKGELYRPFEIIPEVSTSLTDKVYIFESFDAQEVEVSVTAGKNNVVGTLTLNHPEDWQVSPSSFDVNITNKGATETFKFLLLPPDYQSEGYISPEVTMGGKTFNKQLVEIDYSHIPFQTVLLPNESKVVRLDIQKRGENIGYIQGAGDVVPESLEQIGYNVVTIPTDEITPESLARFDAIVVGIRAYNVVDELKFKQEHLFNFVENGGNLIVQYNTSRRTTVDKIAPYDLKLSRDRVTDENAEVRFINPDHELLNFPNKITEKDFDGWVQERGLYFPNEWADEFTPLISINDKGESPKDGSLLVAKHGKGHYIYTGLSFFREFPAGVSGAYRLFANMLSIGKDNINTNVEKKLTD